MTDPLARFTADLAAAADGQSAQEALHRLACALVGARLFTVMRVDLELGVASRSYTSDPTSYPTSGTKPMEPNPWFEIVGERHETFVANTLAEIAGVFPDHALIGSLGCGSVVNLPVLRAGRLVGTINLLDVAGHYTPARVVTIETDLKLPAMAALLAADDLVGTVVQ